MPLYWPLYVCAIRLLPVCIQSAPQARLLHDVGPYRARATSSPRPRCSAAPASGWQCGCPSRGSLWAPPKFKTLMEVLRKPPLKPLRDAVSFLPIESSPRLRWKQLHKELDKPGDMESKRASSRLEVALLTVSVRLLLF